MKHSIFLSQIKKLKVKLFKAYRSGSRKHIVKAHKEIDLFKKKHQQGAYEDWLAKESEKIA